MNIEENVTNGLYERFNMDQCMKWYSHVRPPRENEHINHPLVGTKYLYVWKDGEPEEVVIKTVVKHWYAGYYYYAVYENSEGSSGTVVIENINSIAKWVEESFDRFCKEFTHIS